MQHEQRLFREGLAQLLAAEDDVDVCGTVVRGDDLRRLCTEQCPHAVLLEADASAWDVPRLCAGLRRVDPHVRLIGLTAAPTTPAALADARRWGMSALVSRVTGIAGVLAALRPVGATVAVLPERPGGAVLTPRECHVLALVGAGHTSREISDRLDISPKTVENHKQRIFAKLGVQNQAHAVSVAIRSGLLRADVAVGD